MIVFFDRKQLLLEVHSDAVAKHFLETASEVSHLASRIRVSPAQFGGLFSAIADTRLIDVADLDSRLDSALEHIENFQ